MTGRVQKPRHRVRRGTWESDPRNTDCTRGRPFSPTRNQDVSVRRSKGKDFGGPSSLEDDNLSVPGMPPSPRSTDQSLIDTSGPGRGAPPEPESMGPRQDPVEGHLQNRSQKGHTRSRSRGTSRTGVKGDTTKRVALTNESTVRDRNSRDTVSVWRSSIRPEAPSRPETRTKGDFTRDRGHNLGRELCTGF